ncbi:MAG: PA14 domain-containing protein, partial [Anaerolineae bacterium]
MVIRTHRNRWLLGVGVMLALLGLGLLVALASPVPNLVADEAPLALESARALTYTSYLPLISHPRTVNTWYAEYYSNVSLSGEPVRTAKEARVDYDWGSGAPAGLPANEFSARWIGDWNFERGQYTFFVLADDGIRLWLDDQLLIDDWLAGRTEHAQSVFVASEGLHQLKLEYFEESQRAAIWIHWRRTDLYP